MPHTPAPDTLRGTYWNKRYREEGAIWGDRPSPTAEWAQRHFRERGCDSLLVAGCGYGRNLSCFAGQGYTRLLGLDLSSEAVEMARRNFPELDLRCGDLLELAPEPAPFSALYAFNLLHFFLAEGRRNFADAARRLLAPGGLLAISALSEVGAQPGPFRVSAGELPTAFAGLRQIAGGECGGEAWLLARRIEQRQSRCFHPR